MSHHRIVKRIRPSHHLISAEKEGSCECCATRNEKLRGLAKSRREQEGEQLALLADLLPFPPEVKAKLDKVGVLRLAVAYLKAKHLVRRGSRKYLAAPSVKEAQMMLDTLDGFLIVVNHDGQIIFISDQVTTCLGVQPYEMVGASILEFVCPSDYGILVRNCLKKTAKSKSAANLSFDSMETDEISSDSDEEDDSDSWEQQKEFIVRMKYKIVQNDKGKQTGFIPIQWSGKAKKLEVGGRQRASRCLGLVAICRPILSAFMEVDLYEKTFVVRYSANHLLTYVDDRITMFLGYEPSELLGSCLIDYYHPEDFHKIIRTFAKDMWAKGSNVADEFRVVNKRGEWVWVQCHGAVVYGPRKEPLFAIFINHITNHNNDMSRSSPYIESGKGKFNNNVLKQTVAAESEVGFGQCKHRGRHVCLKFQMEREYGCRPPSPDTAPASHVFDSSSPISRDRMSEPPGVPVQHDMLSPRRLCGEYKQPDETLRKVQPMPVMATSLHVSSVSRDHRGIESMGHSEGFSLLHDLLRRKKKQKVEEEEKSQSKSPTVQHLNVKEISGDVSLKDLLSTSLRDKSRPHRHGNVPCTQTKNKRKDHASKQRCSSRTSAAQVPTDSPGPHNDIYIDHTGPHTTNNVTNSKRRPLSTDLARLPDEVSGISLKEEKTTLMSCDVQMTVDDQSTQPIAEFPCLTNTLLTEHTLAPLSNNAMGVGNCVGQSLNLESDVKPTYDNQLFTDYGFPGIQQDDLAQRLLTNASSPLSDSTGSTCTDSGIAVTSSPHSDLQGTPSPMAPTPGNNFEQNFPQSMGFISAEELVGNTRKDMLSDIFQVDACSSTQNTNNAMGTTINVDFPVFETTVASQITSDLMDWMQPAARPEGTPQLTPTYEKTDSPWQKSSQEFAAAMGPLPNLTLNDIDQTLHLAENNNEPEVFPSLTEKLLDNTPVSTCSTTSDAPYFSMATPVFPRSHVTESGPCDMDSGDSLRYLLMARDNSLMNLNTGR